jgi:aldehyde dehydrogenase (NAD+)
MGRAVAASVAKRLGKYLLELGGNNAVIITESSDLKIAIPGIVFGAVGTAGQRCTSTRRIMVNQCIYAEVKKCWCIPTNS